MKEIVEVIGNKEYFFALENQVRKLMPKYEAGILLPICRRIFKKNNIRPEAIIQYPIEGYYHKTPSLTEYFTLLRNLQLNEEIFLKVSVDEDILFLRRVTNSPLFGREQSFEVKNAILPRRKDSLTLAIENEAFFNQLSPRPWSIEKIRLAIRSEISRPESVTGLVDLAGLIDCPICLLSGAETNSAYREIAYVSGCYLGETTYEWAVLKEVEDASDAVISNYKRYVGLNLTKPSIFNISDMNYKVGLPRVSWLGQVRETKENYFWLMNKYDSQVRDVYSNDIITTENLIGYSNKV